MENQNLDKFDRALGALVGLPDVVSTKATTIRAVTPIVGLPQTFIVQTYRQAGAGDTLFIEHFDGTGVVRLVVPAAVTDAIARQRDALSTKVRSKVAKAAAQERKDRGEVPAFMRPKKATA